MNGAGSRSSFAGEVVSSNRKREVGGRRRWGNFGQRVIMRLRTNANVW